MLVDTVHKRKYIFDESTTSLYNKCISDLHKNLDYMFNELKFEHVKIDDDGYSIVDLTQNCNITYKNIGITLVQCPLFEQEHTFTFYSKLVLDAYPEYKFTDKVVFDCGACCGLDAILFSKEAKHVYCLEPDSKNFENLSANTKEYPNITVIKKALFNHCNEIEFTSENSQGSMILGKSIDIPVEEIKTIRNIKTSTFVTCTTLNEMMNLYGTPDIVKIDIEGSEYDLIHDDSMKNVLNMGPILIFEIHQRPGSSSHYVKLVDYIKSFGYTIIEYSDHLLGEHISCIKY